MDGDSGGNNTTTIQKSDPWAGQIPYLSGGTNTQGQQVPGTLPSAAHLFQNQPGEFYPGQTFAPFSPETLASQQAQTNRAIGGSPITGAMQNEVQKNLQGGYLDARNNPFLQQMGQSVAANVLPQINARFGSSGRANSGLGARAASEGLGSALGGLAYQNYNDERSRMMQSAAMAPEAANQDYYDIAKLGEVGNQREQFAQQGIDEARSRFDFQNQEPWNRLGKYNALIQGNYGGQSSGTSTAPRGSLGAGLLGGGLGGGALGYGLGGMTDLFTKQQGAIGGAGLGMIGGLLSR